MLTIADILAAIDAQKRSVGNKVSGLLSNPGAQIEQNIWQGTEDVQRDPVGTAMGLLTFAGVGAKTADKGLLAKAQQMVKEGVDPGQVWRTTGWTDQFPDRKWRFEISDAESRIKPWVSDPNTVIPAWNPVSKTVEHQQLLDAYPTIKRTPYWAVRGEGGQYSPGKSGIQSGISVGIGNADVRSVSLHELQHAIQQREGFARGGSPEMFRPQFEDAQKIATSLDRLTEARMKGERSAPIYNPISGETTKIPAHYFDGWEAMLQEELSKAMKITQGLEPYEAYRRLAGEAEARLTQQRMNLTPEQRRMQPPWLSFDIPPEQQIIRGLLGN